MRSLRARLLALPPRRLDAALGLLVLALCVLEVLALSPVPDGRTPLALVVAVAVAAAVALRRRAPVLAVGLSFGGQLLAVAVGQDFVDNTVTPFFAVLFVVTTAGYELEGRRLWIAAALGCALNTVSIANQDYAHGPGDYLFGAGLGVGGPMLVGQLLRNRTSLNDALRAKARRLEDERAREAEAAALEERTRIAGELHDVVAHALSAMTVQAGAARRLAARDPERARAAFATTEATGREALTELRRLLGVLRKEDEELALAPQPSLAHVGDLVRRSAAAGLPTELHTEGAAQPLPAGIDLTGYRVVQEALTAARERGAAGRARVAVRYRADDVLVEVVDDGAPRGRGLLGMRERVAVYGGELTAAAAQAGGWRVAARLPLEAAQ